LIATGANPLRLLYVVTEDWAFLSHRLPMARAAVLAGRTLSDVVTNLLSMTILLVTGLIIGFSFHTTVLHAVAGIYGRRSHAPCNGRGDI